MIDKKRHAYHQCIAHEGDHEQRGFEHDIHSETLRVEEVRPRPAGEIAVIDVHKLYSPCLYANEDGLDEKNESGVSKKEVRVFPYMPLRPKVARTGRI